MARQLLSADFNVCCYDFNKEIMQQLHQEGAQLASNASEMARQVNIIILSLPNAEIVEAVIHEILLSIQPGSIVLDTSTSRPATSQRMSALGKSHDFSFVDGPVSGGPSAANAGTMTMLLGGDSDAIANLSPVLQVIAAKTVVVGKSGAGHAAKIANNMLCAANLVLVAEAIRLGEASGVLPQDLLEAINAGSGRSGVSEVNFPKWILNDAFNSGFTMGLMRKDVGLAIDLAKATGVKVK